MVAFSYVRGCGPSAKFARARSRTTKSAKFLYQHDQFRRCRIHDNNFFFGFRSEALRRNVHHTSRSHKTTAPTWLPAHRVRRRRKKNTRSPIPLVDIVATPCVASPLGFPRGGRTFAWGQTCRLFFAPSLSCVPVDRALRSPSPPPVRLGGNRRRARSFLPKMGVSASIIDQDHWHDIAPPIKGTEPEKSPCPPQETTEATKVTAERDSDRRCDPWVVIPSRGRQDCVRALVYSTRTFDTPSAWAANVPTIRRHAWLPEHMLVVSMGSDPSDVGAFSARRSEDEPDSASTASDRRWTAVSAAIVPLAVRLADAVAVVEDARDALALVMSRGDLFSMPARECS